MKLFKQIMVILGLCGVTFLEGYYLAGFEAQLMAVVAVITLTAFLATCCMRTRSEA